MNWLGVRISIRRLNPCTLRGDGNDVFGALMVYSGRPDAFDQQESLVLTELADDISNT